MDFKKEYRLSDLFRRDKQPSEAVSQEEPAAAPEESAEAPERSASKKGIHLFGRRKAKAAESADVAAEQARGSDLPIEPVEEAMPAAQASATSAPAEPTAATTDPAPAHEVSDTPEAEAPTEAPKQSASKKGIHLFGRRKAKGQAAEQPGSDAPQVATPLSGEGAGEVVSERSQPESADVLQPGATEGPNETEDTQAPDRPDSHDRPAAADAAEAAAFTAAAHAMSEPQSDDQGLDGDPEPELPADDVEAVPEPAATERTGRRFARRGGKTDEQAEQGGPERRESPSRRERSTEERAVRAEARSGKTAPLPDIPLFRAINLLPREEAKARRQGPSLQQLAVAVIGLVMLGMLSFVFVLERARVQDRENELQRLQADLAEIQATQAPEAGSSTTEVAGELVTRAGTLSVVLDGRIVWDRLLRQLSLVLPPDVWFEEVTSLADTTSATTSPETVAATARTSTLTIKGYARTQQGVAEMLGRLGVMPEFDLVQLQAGELIEIGDEEVVQFSVAATLKPTGGVAS